MKHYIGGLVIILLSWGIDPAVQQVAEGISSEMHTHDFDEYILWFRHFLSTLTTIVVLVTALIKYRKERKK